MMSEVKCVVCDGPATLYCVQDDANLCNACDEQVHSANALACRHQRVPIASAQAIKQTKKDSVFSAPPGSEPVPAVASNGISMLETEFFAVPDVDMPTGLEDAPTKGGLDKGFVSGDFDFCDVDPLWLDRLDVGLDRLPSDILDSLVPEAPPVKMPAKQEKSSELPQPPADPLPEPVEEPMRQTMAPPSQHMMHAVAYPPQMHTYPGAHMMAYAPPPQAAPSQPRAPPANTIAAKWDASSGTETFIDIDSYIPRSLLPVDAAMHVQQLKARREKLERFREKKRNRHFRKTIRYASRKAYAEVRPRIKGRFARKDEVAAMRAAGILPAV